MKDQWQCRDDDRLSADDVNERGVKLGLASHHSDLYTVVVVVTSSTGYTAPLNAVQGYRPPDEVSRWYCCFIACGHAVTQSRVSIYIHHKQHDSLSFVISWIWRCLTCSELKFLLASRRFLIKPLNIRQPRFVQFRLLLHLVHCFECFFPHSFIMKILSWKRSCRSKPRSALTCPSHTREVYPALHNALIWERGDGILLNGLNRS